MVMRTLKQIRRKPVSFCQCLRSTVKPALLCVHHSPVSLLARPQAPQAMWLVGLLQQGPEAAKAAFERIPESVVADMTGWLSWVIRAKVGSEGALSPGNMSASIGSGGAGGSVWEKYEYKQPAPLGFSMCAARLLAAAPGSAACGANWQAGGTRWGPHATSPSCPASHAPRAHAPPKPLRRAPTCLAA